MPTGSIVPVINWSAVYSSLRMDKPYRRFFKNLVYKMPEYGHWIIPVIKDINYHKLIVALNMAGTKVRSNCRNLNEEIAFNDRNPDIDNSYLIAVRATVEADENNKRKSANTLVVEDNPGITALEYMLLYYAYYLTTNHHLDVVASTLCEGSRFSLRGVPRMFTTPNKFLCITWSHDTEFDEFFRSRSVTFIPSRKKR